jgi:hypothetical protein
MTAMSRSVEEKFETIIELKALAAKMTDELYASLRSGKLKAVNIHEIRKLVDAHFMNAGICNTGDVQMLEDLVLRRVVEKAG